LAACSSEPSGPSGPVGGDGGTSSGPGAAGGTACGVVGGSVPNGSYRCTYPFGDSVEHCESGRWVNVTICSCADQTARQCYVSLTVDNGVECFGARGVVCKRCLPGAPCS
jgi:hypothetical protein